MEHRVNGKRKTNSQRRSPSSDLVVTPEQLLPDYIQSAQNRTRVAARRKWSDKGMFSNGTVINNVEIEEMRMVQADND